MPEDTDEQRVYLKGLLHEVLNERDALDHQTHRAQHEWIATQIAKEQRRTERIERIKTQALGALALGALGAFGKLLLWIGGLVLAALSATHGTGTPGPGQVGGP